MQQQPGSNFNPYAPPTADIHQGVQVDQHGQYVLAERGTRLGAVLIDALLVLASALPAGAVLAFMAFAGRDSLSRGESLTMLYGLGGLMGLMVLAFVGYQWYLVATTGQSLAKRWMGIKIVRLDGSPVGFVHGVILRSWVMSALSNIPALGTVVGLVNALMIFGEERRCLHDHIAGTRVIVAPAA
ncbi:MAG TPA: RDD family protein [Nannocystis sp.]|jgi:uncharacterized RDD family membrane protein YckC